MEPTTASTCSMYEMNLVAAVFRQHVHGIYLFTILYWYFPGMSVHSLPVVSVTHFQKREGVTHYLQEMKTSHVGALCLGVAVLFIFNIMVFALRFIVRRQHKNR